MIIYYRSNNYQLYYQDLSRDLLTIHMTFLTHLQLSNIMTVSLQVSGRVKTISGEEFASELETDVVEEGEILDCVAYGGMHIISTTKIAINFVACDCEYI